MIQLLGKLIHNRVPGHVLSLLFLLVGMGLVAAVILMPTYLENRELEWQRDLLRLQAQRMAEQDAAYRQSLAALGRGEPVLLERLAYEYLNLKPAQTTLVGQTPSSEDTEKVARRIEDWVRRPLPVVGVDLPALQPLPSHKARLAHVATGRARLPMLILGAALVVLGLILPGPARTVARKGEPIQPHQQ